MLIKEDYLFKLTSLGKIQEVHMELVRHDYTKVYTINYNLNQFGYKEIKKPLLQFNSHEAKLANDSYNIKLSTYLKNGYKRLKDLTKTPYHNLTKDILYKALQNTTFITNGQLPSLMGSVSYKTLHYAYLDKQYYSTPYLDGVKCLVYYKDKGIHVQCLGNINCDNILKHIVRNKEFIKFFKLLPKAILDCRIYKHNIYYSGNKIISIIKKGIYSKLAKDLELWVDDIIVKDTLEKRLEQLQILNNYIKDVPYIKLCQYTYTEGVLKIMKYYYKTVDEGYSGILFKRLDKEYGMGKKSVLYSVHMLNMKQAILKIVGTEVKNNKLLFILKLNNKDNITVPARGFEDDQQLYIKKKDSFLGKMAVVQYAEKESNILTHSIIISING